MLLGRTALEAIFTFQICASMATEGGYIIPTPQSSIEINTGVTQQEIGMSKPLAYQVKQKNHDSIFRPNTKDGHSVRNSLRCYPSEGGLIVVNDAGGAGAIT